MISTENKSKLKEFEKLNYGWYDKDWGKEIDKESVKLTTELLDKLSPNFKIFPLIDGYIQIEHSENDYKYIEIEVYDNKCNLYYNKFFPEAENILDLLYEGEMTFHNHDGNLVNRVVNFVEYILAYD